MRTAWTVASPTMAWFGATSAPAPINSLLMSTSGARITATFPALVTQGKWDQNADGDLKAIILFIISVPSVVVMAGGMPPRQTGWTQSTFMRPCQNRSPRFTSAVTTTSITPCCWPMTSSGWATSGPACSPMTGKIHLTHRKSQLTFNLNGSQVLPPLPCWWLRLLWPYLGQPVRLWKQPSFWWTQAGRVVLQQTRCWRKGVSETWMAETVRVNYFCQSFQDHGWSQWLLWCRQDRPDQCHQHLWNWSRLIELIPIQKWKVTTLVR